MKYITWNNGSLNDTWYDQNPNYYLEKCPDNFIVSVAHEWLQDVINKDFVTCKRCRLRILVNGPEWDNIMECYPHYESKTSGWEKYENKTSI